MEKKKATVKDWAEYYDRTDILRCIKSCLTRQNPKTRWRITLIPPNSRSWQI